jgi:signal transduction histidine kinase/CheY-like chemotaxis protein
MVLMQTEAMFLLLFDRLAYIYRGNTSDLGYYMVRVSNFFVYLLSLMLVHAFNLYLMDLYKNEGGLKRIPKRLVVGEAVYCAGLILLTISQFTGLYYTFDEYNRYHRSPGIYISFLIPVFMTLLQISAVIQYRKLLDKYELIPIILFTILPYVATVAQIFLYGLSLTNITMVGMVVLLYLFEIIKMNKMQEAKLAAERASNAKSRFLANISHEIRTPINTIMGMNEMIMREDASGVPKPYFLSIMNYSFDIKNASDTLLGLINDILDMSKIESGKMHLVELEYETATELRNIVSMIKVKSNQKDLTFDIDVDKEVPARMYGDIGKIKQVVLNLLTNAVKYTEKGGFSLNVKVLEKSDDSCKIRISVKDTGIGVKPEDLGKLFSAFERFDETKNCNIQGTGLGLDISKQFANLMDAQLWCESEYGHGSEFIFEVTQKILGPETIGDFKEQLDETARGPYIPLFLAPNAAALIVDDNVMNLNVLRGFLKQTRIKVDTASSGELALHMLSKKSYDLVLLDHMMPGMDGLETARKIREKDKDVPIIALTANYSSDAEAFYLEHGFNGYLSKPVDGETLERKIRSFLPDSLVTDNIMTSQTLDLDNIPDTMQWVNDVKELSVADGVKNSGGVQAYFFSLLLFHDTIDDNSKVILDAYNNDDIGLFTVKVHALKTSARIVGALKLFEDAQKMEEAGKAEDRKYIDQHLDELMEDYRSFKNLLDKVSQAPSDIDPRTTVIASEELSDAYKTIKEYAEKMDYDSVETVLEQIKEYLLPEQDAFVMTEIEKALRALDFEHITEILKDK